MAQDESQDFLEPVPPSVPNYYYVIREPMDFSKIKKRLYLTECNLQGKSFLHSYFPFYQSLLCSFLFIPSLIHPSFILSVFLLSAFPSLALTLSLSFFLSTLRSFFRSLPVFYLSFCIPVRFPLFLSPFLSF